MTTCSRCLKIRREQKKNWRQVNPSYFIKFEKFWQNLEKFNRNAFDERKEQEFFENTKIGRICRIIGRIGRYSAEHI
jgi:uncharacterized C2H2 Zn-finger protein